MFRVLLMLSAWLLTAGSLAAQGTSSQIVGRLTDPSGAAIPGVDVRIENVGTGVTRQTASRERGA